MSARDHLSNDEFSLSESDVVDDRGDTAWGDIGGVDWFRPREGSMRFSPPTRLLVESLETEGPAEYEHAQSIAGTDPEEWPPLLVEDYGTGTRKVLDGHHRVAAARMRGVEELPAYRYQARRD